MNEIQIRRNAAINNKVLQKSAIEIAKIMSEKPDWASARMPAYQMDDIQIQVLATREPDVFLKNNEVAFNIINPKNNTDDKNR